MPLNISKFGVPAQSCFGTNTYTDSGVFSISIKLNVGKIVLSKFQSFTQGYLKCRSTSYFFPHFFLQYFPKVGRGNHYVHGHTNQFFEEVWYPENLLRLKTYQ